jgi:hypothetical protein
MTEYTNSRDINHRSIEYQEKRSTANAVGIDSITTKVKKEKNVSTCRCSKCKSIISLDGADLLDLNGKRHFCDVPDLISHEEKCMAKIQEIVGYYNRRELASFQVELNIP